LLEPAASASEEAASSALAAMGTNTGGIEAIFGDAEEEEEASPFLY
jgi:hypothetical protein